MRGKLIVIDGNDSSGKKTQAELLAARLREEGYDVESADFPQYYTGFFGKMIARYLNGDLGDPANISPYLSSMLYAQDRWEAGDRLHSSLQSGKVIVCNRYTSSNQAYMAARIDDPMKRDQFLAWLDELEYSVNKIPRPSGVIFLHVPLAITKDWIKHKEKRDYLEGKRKDMHEKDSSYLKKVEDTYIMLAERYGWQKIECVKDGEVLPKEQIAGQVHRAALMILR